MATMDQIADGLRILRQYGDDDVSAEHDVIYASQAPPESMGTVDRADLARLGWFWDENFGCWSRFT